MTECNTNENRPKPPDAIPLFHGLHGKSRAETATLAEIHRLLTAGPELERHTATLRGLLAEGDKDAYAAAKRHTPNAVYAGAAPDETDNQDVPHTGNILVEFDLGPSDSADPAELRRALAALPATALAYISIGGKGVHAVVRATPPPETSGQHAQAYEQAATAARQAVKELGASVSPDPAGKNRNRRAFLCHDPHAYLNTSPQPFPWQP